MQLVIDARTLLMYPVGQPTTGLTGGTEKFVHVLGRGLADLGHSVHVVCPDIERMEQRGPTLFYWGPDAFPQSSDVAILVQSLEFARQHDAKAYVWASTGLYGYAGPDGTWASGIDVFPCFSTCHADLLAETAPTIDRAKCVVTGLGVDLKMYPTDPKKVPNSLFFSNDPARGLFHLLDIFDVVKERLPDATLRIGYDFDRQFALVKWEPSATAQQLWDCHERIQSTPGVTSLGALTPEQTIAEQHRAAIHVMPSEPPNVGSQIHGLMQMECAAASTPLVLSDIEAFPEVFGGVAECLPVPGTWFPDAGRVTPTDWANVVCEILTDPALYAKASADSRALAEKHTWARMIDNWQIMLEETAG